MVQPQPIVLAGTYALAGLPDPTSYPMNLAWVTDQGTPATPKLYWSDGTSWQVSAKRQETYSGVTDASGNWSVTYPYAYGAIPNVQPVLINADDLTVFKIPVSTTTGFTINVVKRSKLTVLTIDLLSFLATPVVGASLKALVVES